MVVASTLVAALAVACGDGAGDPGADGGPPTTGPTSGPGTPPGTPDPADLDGTDGTDDTDDGDGDGLPAEVEVVETDLVTGLEAPWDVAFLGGRTFVTERDSGRIVEVTDGEVIELRTLQVNAAGEGGLLGLAAGDDGRLYVYLTTADDNRVVRLSPDDDAEPEVVLDGIPRAATHNGGRLVFGPDGMLYVGTGDAQDPAAAQDPDSLAGKVLRIAADGAVPDDNPVAGSPVWSLGHRNVQGLTFDRDGRLFASEFGPDRDDEINLIEPGGNHGWPEVTGAAGVGGFVDPVLVRQPGEASWTGASVLLDGAIPQWEGDLFVAALRGGRLYRVPLLDDGGLGEPEELYVGTYGRLRHVVPAPDGSLWLLTNERDGRGSPGPDDDRIVRVGPAA